ncbi:MAG: hypothetical protein WC789_12765 [Lentisphaeria bacterium]|jgi:hypothetical protein
MAVSRQPSEPSPKRTPLPSLLSRLFLDPGSLYGLLAERRRRGVALLLAAGLLAGLLVGATESRRFLAAAAAWCDWFATETVALRVTPAGELAWDRPAGQPRTVRRFGWRLDYNPAGGDLQAFVPGAAERRGLWLAPRDAVVWQRPAGSGLFLSWIVKDGKALNLFTLRQAFPNGQVWDKAAMQAEWQRAQPWFALAWSGLRILGVWFLTFFYLALFSLIPLLLRTRLGELGFTRIFSLHCFAALPPLAVATIYSCLLDLPWLPFDSLFVFGFVAYLFWAGLAAARRGLRPAAGAG